LLFVDVKQHMVRPVKAVVLRGVMHTANSWARASNFEAAIEEPDRSGEA
jgi:hypothetical protein